MAGKRRITRIERCLEIRIVDGMPVSPVTGMGSKVIRRSVSANIEDIRLPTYKKMQGITRWVKIWLAQAQRKAAIRRERGVR